jgi:DNA-binding GntR family transcriptional regulator
LDAYQFIRRAIIEGDYEPGKRLTEEFLANELNISRTPIREAIRQLEAEGLVTSLKRGVAVRSYSTEDVQQIYDLRALLEGYAASRAAQYRTSEDLKKLWESHTAFASAVDEFRPGDRDGIHKVMQWNAVFHDQIIQASKNPHIRFLISKVVVLPLVFRSFYWYDLKEVHRSLDTHEVILKSIERKDPDLARAAMVQHIFLGRDHVLTHIQTSPSCKGEDQG